MTLQQLPVTKLQPPALPDVGLSDLQLDYYGKRAAAAAGDFSVHIWDVTEGQQKQVGLLKGHEGPVWKVSWAHPKFGNLIATCGYDMKVIVWKETAPGQWQIAYLDNSHTASVNAVEFAPHDYGLRLACASSDGTVSVLSHSPADQSWRRAVFPAHAAGVQCISWMPVHHNHHEISGPAAMRLATGGCDNLVRVWKCEGEAWGPDPSHLSLAHSDWVRAVAFRPDTSNTLATGSWDRTVVIWAQEMEGQPWRIVTKLTLGGKVESLCWSVTGSLLAVSYGEGETALFKEAYDGHYEEVCKVTEAGPSEPGAAPSPFDSWGKD